MAMEMIDAIMKAKEIKKTLDTRVQGRIMVKQDKRYKGNQFYKIWDFNVYYDTPTLPNRQAIEATLQQFGAKFGNMRVIGGSYGYKIHFRLGEE